MAPGPKKTRILAGHSNATGEELAEDPTVQSLPRALKVIRRNDLPQSRDPDSGRDTTNARLVTRLPVRWRVVQTIVAVLAAVWAAQLADRSRSWEVTCYEQNNCDSLTFTVVSELLGEGRTPYLESLRRVHVSETRLSGDPPPFDLPFQYPPNALPLFGLRTTLPPRLVHAGTAFLSTLACLLLFSHLARRHLPDDRAALLMLTVSFSGVVGFNAELGQTGLIAAALVIAIALMWRHSPLAAGLLLGALAFKPQYAGPILVVAAVRGDWRVLTGAAGTFAAFTAVSGIWYGFDEWMYFAGAARQPNHTVPWMVNWMGGMWHLAPQGLEAIQTAALPLFVIGTLALAVGLWPLRRRASLDGHIAVAVAWSVLFGPNTHPYDLLVLMPSLVYASSRVSRSRLGLLFLLISWVALPQPLRWVTVLALVALAAFCTYVLRRPAGSPLRRECQASVFSGGKGRAEPTALIAPDVR